MASVCNINTFDFINDKFYTLNIKELDPRQRDELIRFFVRTEDTNSLNENSSATESSQEPQTSERIETPVDSDEDIDNISRAEDNYVPDEYNNGSVSRKSRARKGSGRPGRGRASKAVTMYHSQISGDKGAIKIRIRKSNLSGTQPVSK